MGALPMAGAANSNSVQFLDHSVVERSTVRLNDGSVVSVTRTTYDNNTSVTTVVENGETTSFTNDADYQGLVQMLKQPTAPATRAGLSYRYVKTSTVPMYFGPEYKSYEQILKGISIMLPASPLKWAVRLASFSCKLAYSDKSMWVNVSLAQYEVYDSTSYFLGYYKIDSTAKVYYNSSCTGTPAGTDYDTFESLSVI